jgi:hypothetical protein
MTGLRRFTHGLCKVYARFTQGLRKVYARFTWKAILLPMCVNLRRKRLRRVYAEFTHSGTGQLADHRKNSKADFAAVLLCPRQVTSNYI